MKSSSPAQMSLPPRECAICQSGLFAREATVACPSCGMVYHRECWEHNLGCAAYGCGQVNALAPTPPQPAPEVAPPEPPPEPPSAQLPWSFLLLGISALAAVMSWIFYGVPSMLVAAGVAVRLWNTRRVRDRPLIAAAALSLVGIVTGLFFSGLWWTAQ